MIQDHREVEFSRHSYNGIQQRTFEYFNHTGNIALPSGLMITVLLYKYKMVGMGQWSKAGTTTENIVTDV